MGCKWIEVVDPATRDLGGLAARGFISDRGKHFFSAARLLAVLLLALLLLQQKTEAATLTGTFNAVPQGADINLTAEGKLDWVHWGLSNDTSLNRKATVPPQINDFSVFYDTNITYAAAYRYDDNYNGYSWADGTQESAVTNTITGVYVGVYSPQENNGFQFTVPADTTLKTLKVYVGNYAARGRFHATLSGSSTSYSSTALVNSGNGPGGVFTIQFAADSPNQTLTILWVLYNRMGANGNVTLQAATLSMAGANNPPFAKVTLPSLNSAFAEPANVTLSAEAFDPDGTIGNVEFFSNGTKVGEAVSPPYSMVVSNLPAGRYEIATQALDNSGITFLSRPAEVFVHGSGGTLNGSVAVPPSNVNLTDEGNLDWMHWGLNEETAVNRKSLAQMQISNFNQIGTNALSRLTDYFTGWSWDDGVPTISTNNSPTGVFLTGIGNGFDLSVPAGTDLRTLKVYVGLYGGSGNFQAWLSDFSAPAFTDRSLSNAWNSSYAVYTLNYASASAGQTLHIRYRSQYSFDQDYGNVCLAAATLNGAAPAFLFSAQVASSSFTFRFVAAPGRTYLIQYTDSVSSVAWTTLTSVVGSGVEETVTDNASNPHRFYRIETQ